MNGETKNLALVGRGEIVALAARTNLLVARGLEDVSQKQLHDASRLQSLVPIDADYYYKRGLDQFEKRDFDNAMNDFDQAITLDPHHASSFFYRYKIWKEWGMRGRAWKELDEALCQDPKIALYYFERSNKYCVRTISTNLLELVCKDLQEAVRLDPRQEYISALAAAYISRGELYFISDRYEESIAYFSEAIRLEPSNPVCYFMRAESWRSKECHCEAIIDVLVGITFKHNCNKLFLRFSEITKNVLRHYHSSLFDAIVAQASQMEVLRIIDRCSFESNLNELLRVASDELESYRRSQQNKEPRFPSRLAEGIKPLASS